MIIHIQNVEQQDALIFKCFITSFGYKLSIIRLSMLKDDILQKNIFEYLLFNPTL